MVAVFISRSCRTPPPSTPRPPTPRPLSPQPTLPPTPQPTMKPASQPPSLPGASTTFDQSFSRSGGCVLTFDGVGDYFKLDGTVADMIPESTMDDGWCIEAWIPESTMDDGWRIEAWILV